jgi:hypothetical protein
MPITDDDFKALVTRFVEMTSSILTKHRKEEYFKTVYWEDAAGSHISILFNDSDSKSLPDVITHDDIMVVCKEFGKENFGKQGTWPPALLVAGESEGAISFWACTYDKRTLAAMLPTRKNFWGRLIPGVPKYGSFQDIERNLAACIYKSAWEEN